MIYSEQLFSKEEQKPEIHIKTLSQKTLISYETNEPLISNMF
jgi:hypothetical protein